MIAIVLILELMRRFLAWDIGCTKNFRPRQSTQMTNAMSYRPQLDSESQCWSPVWIVRNQDILAEKSKENVHSM